VNWLVGRARAEIGGPARLRVVVLLAAVLALQSADASAVSAMAPELQTALGLSTTTVGLLSTASIGVGALATLPMGLLVDRVPRVRLLAASIVLWSVATAMSGAVSSYGMLLASRAAMGVVVATAVPVVTSLMGDLFPAAERARVYGFVLCGELLGVGFGFLVSGALAAALSWRYGFWVLAPPGLALAAALRALLPEPARGGQSRLMPGATTIRSARQLAWLRDPAPPESEDAQDGSADRVREAVAREGIRPREHLVVHGDPTAWSMITALRYVLAVPTNRALILASGLGYFFFSGLRTFAVEFLRVHFGLGQAAATGLLAVLGVAALAGALAGGRVADRLIARGYLSGRLIVPGTAFGLAAGALLPGLLLPALLVAAPLLAVGVAGLAGANPPLDAARIDIMHSRLWGRAESARTLLRSVFEAAAPLTFGYVAVHFAGAGDALDEAGGGGTGARA